MFFLQSLISHVIQYIFTFFLMSFLCTEFILKSIWHCLNQTQSHFCANKFKHGILNFLKFNIRVVKINKVALGKILISNYMRCNETTDGCYRDLKKMNKNTLKISYTFFLLHTYSCFFFFSYIVSCKFGFDIHCMYIIFNNKNILYSKDKLMRKSLVI